MFIEIENLLVFQHRRELGAVFNLKENMTSLDYTNLHYKQKKKKKKEELNEQVSKQLLLIYAVKSKVISNGFYLLD